MHIVEGVNVGLDWPEITLVSGRDATGNDVLVLHGASLITIGVRSATPSSRCRSGSGSDE